jgi:hypothetical protein
VPVEQQLLPSPELKPTYDTLVWLFSNRNFDDSPLDRAAQRIELRFGVSSYPHLLLVDPVKLEIIQQPGRAKEAFLASVARARVAKPANPKAFIDRLRAAEERLAKFEENPTADAAARHLLDEDIVVKLRAVQVLAEKDPKVVVARAAELLQVPNDPFRYEVCGVLAEAGDPSAAPALEAVVKSPARSLNPNVLRIQAVGALARCGREGSVAVIAPFATTGDYRNGLTGKAVDTLAAIASRVPETKGPVKEALVRAYPPPGGNDAVETRLSEALARKVHQHLTTLTGKQVPFPTPYDAAARAKLVKSW